MIHVINNTHMSINKSSMSIIEFKTGSEVSCDIGIGMILYGTGREKEEQGEVLEFGTYSGANGDNLDCKGIDEEVDVTGFDDGDDDGDDGEDVGDDDDDGGGGEILVGSGIDKEGASDVDDSGTDFERR
jgi:hypothetical protein